MRTLISCLLVAAACGAEHRPPQAWSGTKDGATDGNPLLVDGTPRWRFDQVFPDDFEDADNYRPLVWVHHEGAMRWFNRDHAHGGQPSAAIENGAVVFSVKGRSDGEMNYRKSAALGFIAPADGAYTLSCVAEVQRWEGGGHPVLCTSTTAS